MASQGPWGLCEATDKLRGFLFLVYFRLGAMEAGDPEHRERGRERPGRHLLTAARGQERGSRGTGNYQAKPSSTENPAAPPPPAPARAERGSPMSTMPRCRPASQTVGLTVGRPQPTVSAEPPWGQWHGPPPEVTRPLLSCTRGGVRGTWRRRGARSALPGVCVGPCGSRKEAVGHRWGLPGPGDPSAASGREDSHPSCASDEAGPPVPSPPDTVSEKASWNRRFRKLPNPVIHTQNVQIPMETPPACYTEKIRIPSLNLKSQQPAPPDEETGWDGTPLARTRGAGQGHAASQRRKDPSKGEDVVQYKSCYSCVFVL